jgi:putative ABC transport system permease protein
VQTIVMGLTTLLAVGASVLAVGLLAASSAPFRNAFERLQGAHLAADFNPTLVTPQQLTAATVDGATAVAGPFTTVSLRPHTVTGRRPSGPGPGFPAGVDLPPTKLAGRAAPGGPVDQLELTSGRWVSAPGEIVWEADSVPFQVGDRISFPEAPGAPTLTVVGLARSIGRSAQAWVSPEQLSALAGPGTPVAYQMLYRFARADTEDEIAADRAAIAAALPPGAFTGAASYLTIRQATERTAATFAPFVVAFGVLGLIMSILIISIVVGGAVSSATRRIGILKALGYTPVQVARAYVGQALIPAVVGAVLGVALGNVAAIPVLSEEGQAFGTGTPGLAPWVSVVVPIGALILVAVAALVPALRAGRLRTVDAIAVGRTPAAGRGRHARRLLGRLPLPRPVSLGLGNPFAQPTRSATIAAAVALGALGVTFGAGLAMSLAGIQAGLNQGEDAGDVVVHNFAPARVAGPAASGQGGAPGQGGEGGPGGGVEPAAMSAIEAAIRAQAGTGTFFSTGEAEVTVASLAGTTNVVTFQGDVSGATYQMISGRWFGGPGEAVVPTAFLTATGLRVGDSVTLGGGGGTATSVRIVGEVLDLHEDGLEVITDAGSLTGLADAVLPGSTVYHVQLAEGSDVKSYVDSLNAALEPLHARADVNTADISSVIVAMDTLTAMLTLMLITVAGLGVLNTVVLDTRERVHDLGVFKALGMSPRQTIAMVLTAVSAIGLVAGLLGVPAGIAVHDWILPAMGRAAGTGIPQVDTDVYHLRILIPLALGGLVIALAGALLPAGWAARTSTTRALRTE